MAGNYSGLCIARQGTIKCKTGDILSPAEIGYHVISTTLPMPCEKYTDIGFSMVDVYIPQAGNTWHGFSPEEFEEQFILINGWDLQAE